jgi:patatin-like phospholipase/acyl hydrolase
MTEDRASGGSRTPASGEGRFQILALDGGGLKGLFSAAVLAELESDLRVSIAEHFDLITGTSTGGLIALGLGAGVAPSTLVDFYVEHGPRIFLSARLRPIRQWFRSKHRGDELRASLREILGQRLLGESAKRLLIPSYSLDADDVYIFKTPHHPKLRRDHKTPMVDVGMATTAAPTFLPAYRLGNNRLIDGGVWANNPTLVGVAEAVSMLGATLSEIYVLSLGTTDPVARNRESLDRGGFVQWARASTRVFLRAQSFGTFHAAEHLVGADHIHRIDARVPDRMFRLDRLDARAIRGLAEDVSRRHSPAVSTFVTHRPAPYTPLQDGAPAG